MPTERLYYTDSGLLEFSALIAEITQADDYYRIILDKTAFYPTGGGQPHDVGALGSSSIVDVQEDDAGIVSHIVKDLCGLEPGETVTGKIDARRRRDHLQQHSGQHILSQAFIQACGAETRSFHMGAETCTIDIDLASPTAAHMTAAEDIANSVIFDDRPMRVHLVTEEEAARLPLRKDSQVSGLIRVIEVEDFDWSPCGGTHAHRTGQVGLVVIKSFERAKKMTRVEFVCGGRALADYRLANQSAVAVARQFSAERESGPTLVEKMIQDNKALKKRARDLLELALAEEGSQLYAQAPENETAQNPNQTFKLVHAVFDGRDAEELRLLAYKVLARGQAVVLLGSKDAGAARLVFARSQELPQDMGALLTEACAALGGKGGGKPELAQGGGPNTEKLSDVIDAAVKKVV